MPYAYTPPAGDAVAVAFKTAYTPPLGDAVAIAFKAPGEQPTANDESYSASKNTPLHVAAPGVLANDTDPLGEGLAAFVAIGPTHGTLTLNTDGSFDYTPTTGYIGVDAFSYTARNTDGLDSDPATVTITVAIVPVIRYVTTGADLPWSHAPQLGRATLLSFGLSLRARRSVGFPWSYAPVVARATTLAWKLSDRVRRSTALAFALAPSLKSNPVTIPSDKAPSRTVDALMPWGKPPSKQMTALIPYRKPPSHQIAALLLWTVPPVLQRTAALPFLHPTLHKRYWWLPWAHAKPVQWHVRAPNIEPPIVYPPDHYVPPAGDAVAINFACPQLVFEGDAVPVPFGPAACYFAWPKPRIYTVLNTASVVTLPDGDPLGADGQTINVSAIDISESIDDTFHSFVLTLALPDDLAWLLPTVDGPVAVRINLNGYIYTGIVESWATDHQFPGRSVTVQGRALCALLDAPYAPQRAYVETSSRLAQQLVDQELTYTGFTAAYGAVNWTVPAGVWHYDASSPSAAIKTIAAASGSVARSHPWDKVIDITPRYPVSPWDWSITAPDKTILDDFVPRYVERDSASGTPIYEIDIPLWPSSVTDKPGLVRPGALVEFASLEGWKAQVLSTKIAASVQQGGDAAALVILQTLTLEAPPADPRYDYVLVSGAQVGVSDPVIRAGRAGTVRLPQINDPLITAHAVAAERGRNAIAGGGDNRASSNLWASLVGLLSQSRYIKGNVTANNADGSVTVATSDGSTIRARPLPGQTWAVLDGVFVQDGRVVDSAPSLPGITQTV